MTITKVRASRRATRALSKASLSCAAALAATAGIGTHTASASHIEYTLSTLALGSSHPGHFSPTGDRFSVVTRMNPSGQVIGNQTFYQTTAAHADGSDRYGQSAWFHGAGGIDQIGFTDGIHLDGDTNYRFSQAMQLNDQGYVIGHSHRFLDSDGVETAGQSAWLYYNGDIAQIGLLDPGTYVQGQSALSTVVKLNNAATPQVVGTSHVFRGGNDPLVAGDHAGTASWRHTGGIAGVSDRIGLVDAEHTRTSSLDAGYEFKSATVGHLNDLGTAAGVANRYHHETTAGDGRRIQIGQSAWLQSVGAGSEPIKLGFIDAAHTRDASDEGLPASVQDGTRISTIVALNNADLAVGHSNRYDPTTGQGRGQTAWSQSAASANPTALGYYDATHTSSNGSMRSEVQQLNDAGYAMGFSYRYDGGGAINSGATGRSAWLHSAVHGRERLGLTNGEHTGENGWQSSSARLLNDVGHAAGTSSRFLPTGEAGSETQQPRGTSAWLHTPGVGSSRVGLYEGTFTTAHTRDDGTQNSSVVALNNDGHVVGHSTRYTTGETINWGQSAWIFDGTENQQLGLVDDEHRRANGFQHSTVLFLNEAGQAAGYSFRYNLMDPPVNAEPGEPLPSSGQTGWFWDGTTSIPLVFSEENETNFTDVKFLSDTGVVLGSYTDFSGPEDVERGFYWNYNLPEADRFHDLGTLPAGGLAGTDWESLSQALELSDMGHIRGLGLLSGESMPFLLTPIPEPTGLAVIALGGLALLPRRRR